MPRTSSRRQFLSDVGKGTLIATIGPALAAELGLAASAAAEAGPECLAFGEIEPLVSLMQETPVGKLQSALLEKHRAGEPLKRLLAAGALANARSFGGHDYVGFHTLMALMPALHMAELLPSEQAALPVFKVLYRNTNRIQEFGGRPAEVLRPVAADSALPPNASENLRKAVHAKDAHAAEKLFVAMVRQNTEDAFGALLEIVQENPEVHRTVLPYRSWDLLEVVGRDHAATLLRQSLRYCINSEGGRQPQWEENGKILTRLLDEHRLLSRGPGTKSAEDSYVEELSSILFSGTPEQAAGAMAAALAEGYSPAVLGEALSLAANQIVLRDEGRPVDWEAPGKPPGSVHGDSVGVHASDSVNAWRNLSRVSRGRNVHACLILGAWQVARDRSARPELARSTPLPAPYHLREFQNETTQEKLLGKLHEAIRQNMQGHATAAVQRWGELGFPETAVFQALLRYAISEDGALHAEKYFHTVWDDFHNTRPALRWRHLAALARVTASEYGRPAPGQEEARALLKIS